MPHLPAPAKRPLSLGVIFLTLYIDLIGFSIIFPLLPSLIEHYLLVDGHAGLLGRLLNGTHSIAQSLGIGDSYTAVLFGGAVGSVFSILQFIFAPIWGGMSDRIGRRPVLVWTVAGTALGYLIWAISGSFWMFVLSRVVCGAFGGNLSVATAAVADVTTREERSKAMGLVGAAFGLGLVTGPAIGALSMHYNPLVNRPELDTWGIDAFSFPALIAFGMSVINLIWISRRFRESLDPAHAAAAAIHTRERNPLKAILSLSNAAVRRTNLVAFVFSTAFVAMEVTLTYLASYRFHFTAFQNGMLLAFLGFCSIIAQGVIVRRLLARMSEVPVLRLGLIISIVGFVLLGIAPAPWVLYVALVFTATGSGLINPSTTGLISLYTSPSEQGRVLGIFRSLGSLSRAITPILAGLMFWACGAMFLYTTAALVCILALYLAKGLPRPQN